MMAADFPKVLGGILVHNDNTQEEEVELEFLFWEEWHFIDNMSSCKCILKLYIQKK